MRAKRELREFFLFYFVWSKKNLLILRDGGTILKIFLIPLKVLEPSLFAPSSSEMVSWA